MHGLRHAYTQQRYEELTGWKSPAVGGPTAKVLTQEQKVIDQQVRLTISRELGHERIQVVGLFRKVSGYVKQPLEIVQNQSSFHTILYIIS